MASLIKDYSSGLVLFTVQIETQGKVHIRHQTFWVHYQTRDISLHFKACYYLFSQESNYYNGIENITVTLDFSP